MSKNYLGKLGRNWEYLARKDTFWAILTETEKKRGRWDRQEFFDRGKMEINGVLDFLTVNGISLNYGRALDFGCGIGRLSQALADHFAECIGVDISPTMITKACEFNQKVDKCKYVLNQKEDLSLFPDGNFDFVYSNIVLQHMRPTVALSYIAEFVRKTKPGGVIAFQLPSQTLTTATGKSPGLKGILRRITPAFLLQIYRVLRGKDETLIEMNCIDKTEVIQFLEDQGATVLHVVPDTMAGPAYVSYLYYARKGRFQRWE